MIEFSDEQLASANIDKAASEALLRRLNRGEASPASGESWESVQFDGRTVVDSKSLEKLYIEPRHRSNLASLLSSGHAETLLQSLAPAGFLDQAGLEALGLELLPLASFGILNGGAATSYVDISKNTAAYGDYFKTAEGLFKKLAGELAGKPKGLAPAFFNSDGSSGPSFLALKLHNLALLGDRYKNKSILVKQGINLGVPLLPWVQMANAAGLPYLSQGLGSGSFLVKENHPLAPALKEPLTGLQKLITAFTHPMADQS